MFDRDRLNAHRDHEGKEGFSHVVVVSSLIERRWNMWFQGKVFIRAALLTGCVLFSSAGNAQHTGSANTNDAQSFSNWHTDSGQSVQLLTCFYQLEKLYYELPEQDRQFLESKSSVDLYTAGPKVFFESQAAGYGIDYEQTRVMAEAMLEGAKAQGTSWWLLFECGAKISNAGLAKLN